MPQPSQADLLFLQQNPDAANAFREHFGYIPAGQNDIDFVKKNPDALPAFKEHFGYSPPELTESGTLGSLGRAGIGSIIPSAAGVAAFTPGLRMGAAAATLVGQPELAPITGIIGGLITSMAAGGVTGKAQQSLLEAHPEVANMLGQGEDQRAADRAQHPYASAIGEFLPQLAFMSPGGAATGIQRAIGAAIGGGQTAVSEELQGGKVDPVDVLLSTLAGATLTNPTRLGRALGLPGHVEPPPAATPSPVAPREAPEGQQNTGMFPMTPELQKHVNDLQGISDEPPTLEQWGEQYRKQLGSGTIDEESPGLSRPIYNDPNSLPPVTRRAVLYAEKDNAINKMKAQLGTLDPDSDTAKALKSEIRDEEYLRDSHGNLEDINSTLKNLGQDVDSSTIAKLATKRSNILAKVAKIHADRDKARMDAIQLNEIDPSALDSNTEAPDKTDLQNSTTPHPEANEPQLPVTPENANPNSPIDTAESQRALDAADAARKPAFRDQKAPEAPPGQLPDVPSTKQQFMNETMDRQMAANESENAKNADEAHKASEIEKQSVTKASNLNIDELMKEMNLNRILQNYKIKRASIPFGARASLDGNTLYLDHNLAPEVHAKTTDGIPVKVGTTKYTAIHEAVEGHLRDLGFEYKDAHHVAEAAEDHVLKQDNIDPKSYQDGFNPNLEAIELKAHRGEMHDIPDDMTPTKTPDENAILTRNGKDPTAMERAFDKAYGDKFAKEGTKKSQWLEGLQASPGAKERAAPGHEQAEAEKAAQEEQAHKAQEEHKEAGQSKPPLTSQGEKVSRDSALKQKAVQGIVDRVTAKFSEHIRGLVEVRPDFLSNIPEAVLNHLGSMDHVAAYFYKGKIYIDASKMANVGAVVKAVLHEYYHYGVERFGNNYKGVLRRFATLRPDLVSKYLTSHSFLDPNNQDHVLIAGEEALAHIAQEDPHNSFVQNALAAIQGFLRKVGLDKYMGELSQREIIREFIDPVREYLKTASGGENMSNIPKAMDLKGSPLEKFANGKTGVAAWDKDIIPKLNGVVKAFKENKDALARQFVPQSRGVGAKYTGEAVRQHVTGYTKHDLAVNRTQIMNAARMNETALDKVRNAFGVSRTIFSGMDESARMEFIDNMETKKPQPNAQLQAVADVIHKILSTKYAEVDSLSPQAMEAFIENYFPHIWKDPVAAQAAFAKHGGSTLEGKKAFMKERVFKTIQEGLKIMDQPDYKGPKLELASTNPIDLVMMKVQEMDKYIGASNLIKDLDSKGLIHTIGAKEIVPAGYRLLDKTIGRIFLPDRLRIAGGNAPPGDKVASKKGVYVPDDVAQVLENFLGPGLRRNSAFRAYMGVANTLNMAQLGLSMFHVSFTTYDAFVSKFALTAKLLADGEYGRAAMKAAEIPFSPFTNFWRGNKLFEAYHSADGPGGENARMIDSVIQAGGGFGLDPLYSTGVFDSMMRAFNEGDYSSAAIRFPAGIFEGVSRIISHYIVPRQKMGVFADMAKEILVSADKKGWDNDKIRQEYQKAWDSVDNRLGQVVYDNLFWNNSIKDGLLGSVRSLGWNLGTGRELIGGAKDALKGNFSYRASYALMLPLVTAVVGSLIGSLNGQPPDFKKGWKEAAVDMYFPRTGGKDVNGRPMRVSLPSYMKDVFQMFHNSNQTLVDKLNPLLASTGDMLSNKDFYGTQIYGPDDPYMKKGSDILQFMAKQFEPFGFRNYSQESKTGASEGVKAAGFLGFPKAPYWLEQTDAERLSGEILKSKIPVGARTQANYNKSQTESMIVAGLQSTDEVTRTDAFDKMRKGFLDGTFTKKDATIINQKAHSDPLLYSIKHLTGQEAFKVWNVATPEERTKINGSVMKKLSTSPEMSIQDRRDAIQVIRRTQ